MRLRLTLLAALVVLVSLPLAAQTPARPQPPPRIAAGDSSIRGRVVDHATEHPIEGALITLATPIAGGATLITETDREGHYSFEHIAAGRYRILASHPDYVTWVFGASLPTIGPLDGLVSLEARQSRTDVNFALIPGSRIFGRVARHDGQPLNGARILATLQFGDGGFTILPNSSARTNARGEFTLSNLPEGRYQIGATWTETDSSSPDNRPASSRTASPPRSIYYPGTSNAQEAIPVAIARGTIVRNIDITFPATELLRISGKIIRSGDGEIEAFLMTGPARQPLTVGRDGAFTTPQLRAGRYTLVARARSDDAVEAALATIDLSFDLSDVVLGLMPTGIISGRVVTDDGSRVSEEMQVAAVLADEGKELDEYRRDRSEIAAGGAFAIHGVFGQRVMRMVGVTAGWKIARVTVGKAKEEATILTIAPGDAIEDVLIVLTRS